MDWNGEEEAVDIDDISGTSPPAVHSVFDGIEDPHSRVLIETILASESGDVEEPVTEKKGSKAGRLKRWTEEEDEKFLKGLVFCLLIPDAFWIR